MISYYEKNKSRIKKYNKEYYEKNKEKIKEYYNKKQITCSCGTDIMENNKTRHEKTKKHYKLLKYKMYL